MVRETAYIKPGDDVPNIGTSPQFEEGIATLENPSDTGDKIPVSNGFAIPLLVDKKEPRDAEFDEVRSQVTEVVKLEKARAEVEAIARQIAEGAGSAAGLTAAASVKGLKAADQKGFILGSPLGQGPSASTSEELENAIYAMRNGDVTKTPIKIGDNWYIAGVTQRTDANMDDFAKERDDLMEQFLNRKRGEVFSDYMAATRRKLEADGDIKIYDDAIAKLDEESLPIGADQEQ
jgi:parvulin-like peptidyl-prolyl isomerase